MVHRRMLRLDPLGAECTYSVGALKDLNQSDTGVELHLECSSSVTLPEADLALAVTLPDAFEGTIHLAT